MKKTRVAQTQAKKKQSRLKTLKKQNSILTLAVLPLDAAGAENIKSIRMLKQIEHRLMDHETTIVQLQHRVQELAEKVFPRPFKKPGPKYGITKILITDTVTIKTKVVPDAYGCDGIIPHGQTGELHVTQRSYKSYEAYRDAEALEILSNGFKTEYTPTNDGMPLFSGVHPDNRHLLTWRQRFGTWLKNLLH